jgi:predicted DCC family thiol-disulfide oxidoreductase YuxK
MSVAELTLYYDGKCPFCTTEMSKLRQWDKHGRLAFVDIAAPDFNPVVLGIEMTELGRELYSQTSSGKILVGIDSLLAAYTKAGKSMYVFPLRFKLVRPLFTYLYRQFARNRYRMSQILRYKLPPQCDKDSCRTNFPFSEH